MELVFLWPSEELQHYIGSVYARCGVSNQPLSSNGSRRCTVSCRICFESVDTSCDRLTTVCSALVRSLNGMR